MHATLSKIGYSGSGMLAKRSKSGSTKGGKNAIASRPKAALTLKVSGPGVKKGRIPIPYLIRVCEEAQNAVTRQAEALEGRKTIHPGPATVGIRKECTLELISIDQGSTVLGFDFAEPQLILPMPGQKTLGIEALGEIATAIQSLGNGDKKKDHDPGVLRSIYGISGLIDSRITSLTWETPNTGLPSKSGVIKPFKAKINKTVRERAAAHLSRPTLKPVQIDGVLDMADFSRKDRKCRVDPAIGVPVLCFFGLEFEEQVQANIRQPVRVRGIAKIQAHSDRIEHVQMSALEPLSSMSLGEGSFLQSPNIEELADAQNVAPYLKGNAIDWLDSDEEIEAFVSEIYKARKAT